MVGLLMNGELESMWNEAFMACLKALSWHFPERLRKTTGILSESSLCPDQDQTS
jgi:hypothetical protein